MLTEVTIYFEHDLQVICNRIAGQLIFQCMVYCEETQGKAKTAWLNLMSPISVGGSGLRLS
jgi:hypothetical protein